MTHTITTEAAETQSSLWVFPTPCYLGDETVDVEDNNDWPNLEVQLLRVMEVSEAIVCISIGW